MDRRERIRLDRMPRFGRIGRLFVAFDVLQQRSAHCDDHRLHPPADSQERKPALHRQTAKTQF